MSTLVEIQLAIETLEPEARKALGMWLESQNDARLDPADEEALLESLDEAANEIDGGKGISLDDARKVIRGWSGR